MKNIVLAVAVLLALSVMVAQADVRNVSLEPVGPQGVSGTATIISGQVAGPTPHVAAQISVRMNQAAPENQVYEAWLIDSDNNYLLSLGAFDGLNFNIRRTFVGFTGSDPYNNVAVSLEPARSTNPAPTTVVAQGNLPGQMVAAADFSRLAILPDDEMFQRQIAMERFNLTSQQVTDLRMMGFSYSEISLIANAAIRCDRPPTEVANLRMQGQSWSQIATACGTTVAALMQPVPLEIVAGVVEEVPPTMPMFYQRYPDGRPVITDRIWMDYQRRGYTWQDVAIAANIAAMSGDRIDDLLRAVRVQGIPFRTLAIERGLDWDAVNDIDRWPFTRNGPAVPVTPAPSAAAPPSGPAY